jgi:hypothetical protein
MMGGKAVAEMGSTQYDDQPNTHRLLVDASVQIFSASLSTLSFSSSVLCAGGVGDSWKTTALNCTMLSIYIECLPFS